MEGADGAGREAFEGGAVAFTEPVEGGNASIGGKEFVGEDAGGTAERVFGGEQEVVAVIGRIGSEQETATDGFQQG